jgi:outer membrane biosynthesis protein TonB
VLVVTGVRQLALILVLGLASFGGLYAAAKADSDSAPESRQAVKPAAVEQPQAASVDVSDLGRAEPLPAMRVRKPKPPPPEPEPVVETPVVEPVTPAPQVYNPPPSTPAPSTPSPPQPDPGQSFDDSG